MAVFGVERAYFAEAAAFQKLLRSRNALLRQRQPPPSRPPSPALLETYDEELARAGARVVVRRRSLVAALAPHVQRAFRALHADLPVALGYVTDPSLAGVTAESDLGAALLAGLRDRRALDERRGHTTLGPQGDDLEILLGERPARAHASQGQLRSLVLALKLAEMANIEAQLGDVPVLLLDDVPSELDPDRRRHLFETLAALDAQTLISVADPGVVPPFPARADFVVQRGVVTAAGSPGFTPLQVGP
jgi:DNA replication and repair protein RecF